MNTGFCPTMANLGVTVSLPWAQLIPVYYDFTKWSNGGGTNHIGKATAMSRNKPALFSVSVCLVCLKSFKTIEPLPGDRRFNVVYPDSMRCFPASLRV